MQAILHFIVFRASLSNYLLVTNFFFPSRIVIVSSISSGLFEVAIVVYNNVDDEVGGNYMTHESEREGEEIEEGKKEIGKCNDDEELE